MVMVCVSGACLMFICRNGVDLWEGHYPVYSPGTEQRGQAEGTGWKNGTRAKLKDNFLT